MTHITQARKIIEENNYPLDYNPMEWKDYLDSNCYAYALGLKLDEGFLIGDFIGRRVTKHTPIDIQIEILCEELEELGFEVLKCDTLDIIPENSFKLYIEWNESNEYHFIRQDSDGLWSHKASCFFPVRQDKFGYLIVDPDDYFEGKKYGICLQVFKF